MAGGTRGRGRGKKPQVTKRARSEIAEEEASSSEHAASDDLRAESVEWSDLEPSPPPQPSSAKRKRKSLNSSAKGKEKGRVSAHKKGVFNHEQPSQQEHERRTKFDDENTLQSQRRLDLYGKRLCIGERCVDVAALMDAAPEFTTLFELANLRPVCSFTEQGGYCLELIRSFYMNARHVHDQPASGVYSFETMVRGVALTITPHIIGAAFRLPVDTSGVYYLHGGFDASADWSKVVNGVCLPGTQSAGNSVYSKELKTEYRFLNFIVDYNILPTMSTKIVRWDRLLYMYLAGHPTEAEGLNINIPFLIWHRMARDVKSSSSHERLPYPMLIMRILRAHCVDTSCSTYEHSLGTIDASTVAKSAPPKSPQPAAASISAPARPSGSSSSDDPTSRITSLYKEQWKFYKEQRKFYKEQRRFYKEQRKLSKKLGKVSRMIQAMFDKLGCRHDHVQAPEWDSE